ncbi:GntP family permease [Membranihabitans maritimus]|uniref:GntP family permease n=1 Tax=Membranihabitans maritimus TaxID=2904244 RepID=UPI001F29CCDF|nr:GntP family permease [Membranihabitans maritimus]
MDVVLILVPLIFLMIIAYRGASVIVFAPIAAMLGVLFYNPEWIPAFFSGIFMERLAGFVRLYLPVFLLGAIFGKLIELSGYAQSITQTIIRWLGPDHSILSIVLVGAILTYGGVSLFVVVFALYPFASDLFKSANIPKRLIPGAIALGAFTFTMDSFPGTPQIQNIIPTAFFNTDAWAAPVLGLMGGILTFLIGMYYLNRQKTKAFQRSEGYGTNHKNEPEQRSIHSIPPLYIAVLPLICVGSFNKLLGLLFDSYYPDTIDFSRIGIDNVHSIEVSSISAIWAVSGGLIIGILVVIIFSFNKVKTHFNSGLSASVGGALLATLNTASEYGFGAVIASLPAFKSVSSGLGQLFKDPLINEAVTTTTLAGITGSASGGLSIALASMSDHYIRLADQANIPLEVFHRVASMASGGMDTLPHNGAVITLLAVTGLTHRESYKDIFFLTILKVLIVFVVIGLYYSTGLV